MKNRCVHNGMKSSTMTPILYTLIVWLCSTNSPNLQIYLESLCICRQQNFKRRLKESATVNSLNTFKYKVTEKNNDPYSTIDNDHYHS